MLAMKIQLALDRLSIEAAVRLTKQVEAYIDWVEVGTSLIKEFGMQSVYALKEAFPDKIIVADMKTIDNAVYECQLCYDAGADVTTVMGVSPLPTIEACMNEAARRNKQVMIDLLNTNVEQVQQFIPYDAVLCLHTSKDEQELQHGATSSITNIQSYVVQQQNLKLAVAGGVSLNTIGNIQALYPSVVIIGGAITKAENPANAAQQFKKYIS